MGKKIVWYKEEYRICSAALNLIFFFFFTFHCESDNVIGVQC